MCLIIDTCVLAAVLDPENAEHDEFSPIHDYLYRFRGKMVSGGTKYKREIATMRKFTRILVGFERSGQLKLLVDTRVDSLEDRIKDLTLNRGFNDQHIAAMVVASGAPVVCTNDRESIPMLKDAQLFREMGGRKPAVYTRRRNRDLLARALRDGC